MKKTDPHLYTMQKQPSGFGLAIGLLCCGLCLLAFPRFVGSMPVFLAWVFYVLGLLLLLIGILGAASILFE